MSNDNPPADYDWTKPLTYKGKQISGGAARQVRVAEQGGITNICKQVAVIAAENAINAYLSQMNAPKSISIPGSNARRPS